MSLSCSCSEWDGEGCGYNIPYDFTIYKNKRSCKCKSCGKKISINDCVIKFTRFRDLGEGAELEERPWYFCEECGEIYLNLQALGFCPDIEEYMGHILEEYQEEHAHPAWGSFKNYDFKRKGGE